MSYIYNPGGKLNSGLAKKSYQISDHGFDHDKHVTQLDDRRYDQFVEGLISKASIPREENSLTRSSIHPRKSVSRSKSYVSSSSGQTSIRPTLTPAKSEVGSTYYRQHKEHITQPIHIGSTSSVTQNTHEILPYDIPRVGKSRDLRSIPDSAFTEDEELALALAENLKLEEERKAREQIEDAEFLKVLSESILSERGARHRRRSTAPNIVDEPAFNKPKHPHNANGTPQASSQSLKPETMKKPSAEGQYRNASPASKERATRSGGEAHKVASTRQQIDTSYRSHRDESHRVSVIGGDKRNQTSRPGLVSSLPSPSGLKRFVQGMGGHTRQNNGFERAESTSDMKKGNKSNHESSHIQSRVRHRHHKHLDATLNEEGLVKTPDILSKGNHDARDVKDQKRHRSSKAQTYDTDDEHAKPIMTGREEAQRIDSKEVKHKSTPKESQSKRGTLRKLSVADVILSSKLAKSTIAPKLMECNTCLSDDIPENKVAKLQCGHNFCNDCLVRLFTLSLTDPQHMPPRCCQPNEHIPLKHVDKLLSTRTKSLWNKKYQEYTTANRIYCPQPDCGEWIRPRDITSVEGRDIGKCGRCKTSVCTLCGLKDHGTGDCPKDDELNQVREMGKEFGWQRCYNCRAMVELEKGCNHMTCRCTAEFCMICAAKWKTCNCPWFNFEAAEDDAPPPQFDEQGRLVFHDNDLAWGDHRMDEAHIEEDERVARLLALDFEERLQDEEEDGGDGLWAPLLLSGIGEGVLRLLSRTRDLEGGALDRVRTAYTTTLVEDNLVFGYSDNEDEEEIRRVRSEGYDASTQVSNVNRRDEDDDFDQPFFPGMLQRLQQHYRPQYRDEVYADDVEVIATGSRIRGW